MTPRLAALLVLASAPAFATRPSKALVPVVVAAEDIPAGTVISFDQISQRSVPETAVTASVVKPDSASYIVGQKILFPVLAGDVLLWSFFETKKGAPAGCAALFKSGGEAKKDLARAKQRLLKR